MLSRTLSLATVTLLIGGFLAAPAPAQNQNLEAGKSPSQIFAGTCTACHKGPRGLLRTVSPGSLPGFLRQHYTTSPDMASLLAGFLVSNGAADSRRLADQPKSGKPNRDEIGEPGRLGHGGRRSVRSEEPRAAESQTPAQVSNERGTPKQKLSKRAKPGAEEAPKTETAKPDSAKEEPTKTEASQGDAPKSETANEAAKSEGDKSQGNADNNQAEGNKSDAAERQLDSGKSESAGIESFSESSKSQIPASASVPSETPAPAPATGSAPVTGTTAESAATTVPPSIESAQPSQAIAISAPPVVAPAGPPLPPISR